MMSSPSVSATTPNSSCRHSSSVCKQCQTDKPSVNRKFLYDVFFHFHDTVGSPSDVHPRDQKTNHICKLTSPVYLTPSHLKSQLPKYLPLYTSCLTTTNSTKDDIPLTRNPNVTHKDRKFQVRSIFQHANDNIVPTLPSMGKSPFMDKTSALHFKAYGYFLVENPNAISKFAASNSRDSSPESSSDPRPADPPDDESKRQVRPSKNKKESRRTSWHVFRNADEQMVTTRPDPWHPVDGEVCTRERSGQDEMDAMIPGLWGTFVISLLAGAVAGAAGRIVTAPLYDRPQNPTLAEKMQRKVTQRVGETVQRMEARKEDMRSLVQVSRPSIVRIIPYGAFLFASHEMWKKILQVNPRSPRRYRMSAGALAGVSAVTLTYPLDIVRVRVGQQISKDYSSIHKGLLSIWREGRAGMFRGYLPSVIGIIPYCGVKFYIYDNLKYRYLESTGRRPSFFGYCYYGTFAGVIGQSVAYPMEVVRKRMQLSFPSDGRYNTIAGTLSTVFREEGLKGYFKYRNLNWIGAPIAIGISFGIFEVIRDKFIGTWVYSHY